MRRANIPVNVIDLPGARRLKVGLLCENCGMESFERLSRLHGRHVMICRRCSRRIPLASVENAALIQKAVEVLRDVDPRDGHRMDFVKERPNAFIVHDEDRSAAETPAPD